MSKRIFVASPKDWPGVFSLDAHLRGKPLEGVLVDRTREFAARWRGLELSREETTQTERVVLTPLPCMSDLSAKARQALIAELVAEIEREYAGTRDETGKVPLGRKAILQQTPTGTPRQSKRSPAPFAHCASKGARKLLWQAYNWFVQVYREAAERLRRTGAAAFPDEAFPPPAPFVEPLLEPG